MQRKETEMSKEKKKDYVYIDLVREYMNVISEKIRTPRVVDYENEIATYLTEITGTKIYGRSIHSSINRAILKLCKANEMIQIDGKFFVPNNEDYKKIKAKQEIIDFVKFTKRDVLQASDNIFVVTIEKEQLQSDGEKIKELFLTMIGEDRCFTLSLLDNALLIIIYDFHDDENQQREEFRSRLSEAVEQAWDSKHIEEKPRIKLKMKDPDKTKRNEISKKDGI